MVRTIEDMEDNESGEEQKNAIKQYSSYLDKLEDKYNEAGSTAARLSAIVHSRGWSIPKIVEAKEFDDLSKSSDYVKLYRGVSSPSHKQSFLNGENFMGAGQFGEGLYFSPDRNKALDYVKGDENNLIEVLMPKTAKKGTGYEAAFFDELVPGGEKLYTLRHRNDRNMAGGQSGKNEKLALLGYEYENRGGNPRDNEYIIYNPSMLIVKGKNTKSDSNIVQKSGRKKRTPKLPTLDSSDKKDEDIVDLIVEKYRKAIAQSVTSWINVINKKIQSEDNLENINVADYYDLLSGKQFMNQLEQSITISKLAGMLDTENDEIDFKADSIPEWFKQTFAEQLAYFRSKFTFTTKSWKDFKSEQHDVAFTISGLTRGDLLEDAKWLVDKAITNGDDIETFKRQFKRLIGRKGWQANDNRIYTILDTNSRRSYAAGRWQQAMKPEIMQRRPYLVWVHRDSVVPRPNHLALNNKAIRSDHPFWKVAFPACAFGCRCTAFTANERMLNRMGATILDNPPDPMTIAEQGFQRAAGSMPEVEKQEIIDSTLARLSPEIREKVDREVN